MSYIGADIRAEKSNRDHDRFDKTDKDNFEERFKKFHRKKICKFCSDVEYVLDYKDARMMQSFISEHGKIVPRRISGNCALHQRRITTAIKRARILALVGYTSSGV